MHCNLPSNAFIIIVLFFSFPNISSPSRQFKRHFQHEMSLVCIQFTKLLCTGECKSSTFLCSVLVIVRSHSTSALLASLHFYRKLQGRSLNRTWHKVLIRHATRIYYVGYSLLGPSPADYRQLGNREREGPRSALSGGHGMFRSMWIDIHGNPLASASTRAGGGVTWIVALP